MMSSSDSQKLTDKPKMVSVAGNEDLREFTPPSTPTPLPRNTENTYLKVGTQLNVAAITGGFIVYPLIVGVWSAGVAFALAAVTFVSIEIETLKLLVASAWYWGVLLGLFILGIAELWVTVRLHQPFWFSCFEVAAGVGIAYFGFTETPGAFAALIAMIAGALTIIDGRQNTPDFWRLIFAICKDFVSDVCRLIVWIGLPGFYIGELAHRPRLTTLAGISGRIGKPNFSDYLRAEDRFTSGHNF